MNLHICSDIPSTLTLSAAAQALRVQEDFLEEFEPVFNLCMQIARPKYCFAEVHAGTDEACSRVGDACFASRILRVHLRDVQRAFPSLITCGREIHAQIQACDDLLEKYWMEGMAELRMQEAGEALRRRIRSITGGNIRAMSPGSLGDFPLTEQQKLFPLLGEGPKAIGVELTPQCLMLPQKSASAIYFESDEEYENCMLCLREGCFKRRAPFDESAFIDKFGLTESDVRLQPGR